MKLLMIISVFFAVLPPFVVSFSHTTRMLKQLKQPIGIMKNYIAHQNKHMELFSNADGKDTKPEEFYTLNNKQVETQNEGNVEGFLSTDLLSMGSGKQVRVTLYIILALLPVLLLVPFLMDRSFVPPIDPSEMMRQ